MENLKENKAVAFDKSSWKKLLAPKFWPSWLSLGLLCLCAFIPGRVRDVIAISFSYLGALIPSRPRRLCYANLRTAFPNLSAHECRVLYRKSLAVGFSVLLSYAQPLVLPKFILKRGWRVFGLEYLEDAKKSGKATLFIAPHCYAIDRCGLYLSFAGFPMCTMMHSQRNKVYDWFLNTQRLTFGGAVYERGSGLRTIIRELRQCHSCFFLPDQDLGKENSLFVPFLGVPKATLSSLPGLARVGRAQVMQIFSTYNFKTATFDVHFSPIYPNYPSDNLYNDLKVMNDEIGRMIEKFPEQFMWFLRIFKTRPDNTYPNIYENLHYSVFKKGKSIDYAARRKPYVEDLKPKSDK